MIFNIVININILLFIILYIRETANVDDEHHWIFILNH